MGTATRIKGQDAEVYTGFPVRIEIFEGPLDLLLHLVRRQEVDLWEVRLASITDQYLRTLDTMAAINVDLAGEFLVMAASLLWLKSRLLLPRQEPETAAEELLEQEMADSEQELKQRLEEYRAYKQAAEVLAASHAVRKRVFLRPLTDDDEIGSGFVPLADVSLFDMVAAIQEMLERTKEPPVGIVRPAEITVADCIRDILLKLASTPQRQCSFVELFEFPVTRVVIVLTFLAILELVRRRELRVAHGADARQIIVALAD